MRALPNFEWSANVPFENENVIFSTCHDWTDIYCHPIGSQTRRRHRSLDTALHPIPSHHLLRSCRSPDSCLQRTSMIGEGSPSSGVHAPNGLCASSFLREHVGAKRNRGRHSKLQRGLSRRHVSIGLPECKCGYFTKQCSWWNTATPEKFLASVGWWMKPPFSVAYQRVSWPPPTWMSRPGKSAFHASSVSRVGAMEKVRLYSKTRSSLPAGPVQCINGRFTIRWG